MTPTILQELQAITLEESFAVDAKSPDNSDNDAARQMVKQMHVMKQAFIQSAALYKSLHQPGSAKFKQETGPILDQIGKLCQQYENVFRGAFGNHEFDDHENNTHNTGQQ